MSVGQNHFVMAGLDPATQQARVGARNEFLATADAVALGGRPGVLRAPNMIARQGRAGPAMTRFE
jgi:hypothetical protein